MQKYIKKIRRSSNFGLFGSIAVAMVVILFVVISKHRFYMDDGSYQRFLIAGLMIAVVDISAVLFSVRKQIPRFKQLSSIEEKLRSYASLMSQIYYGTLIAVAMVIGIVVLSNNTQLIMLLVLMVLSLFFLFPNMYKVKVDLGLDNTTMKQLYGDAYVADKVEEETASEMTESALTEDDSTTDTTNIKNC